MILKLLVHDDNREAAINRMLRALGELEIVGVGIKTTIDFHKKVFNHPSFRRGEFFTDFIIRHAKELER